MQQQRETGVIARYYDLRGFGFIAMNGAESGDIFVHASEVRIRYCSVKVRA